MANFIIVFQLFIRKKSTQIAEDQIQITVAPEIISFEIVAKQISVGGFIVTEFIGLMQYNGKIELCLHYSLQCRKVCVYYTDIIRVIVALMVIGSKSQSIVELCSQDCRKSGKYVGNVPK